MWWLEIVWQKHLSSGRSCSSMMLCPWLLYDHCPEVKDHHPWLCQSRRSQDIHISDTSPKAKPSHISHLPTPHSAPPRLGPGVLVSFSLSYLLSMPSHPGSCTIISQLPSASYFLHWFSLKYFNTLNLWLRLQRRKILKISELMRMRGFFLCSFRSHPTLTK